MTRKKTKERQQEHYIPIIQILDRVNFAGVRYAAWAHLADIIHVDSVLELLIIH